MDLNEQKFRDLQQRLAIELSEKEQLQEENRTLKAQIDEFRILYVSTVEYASSIENELEERIKSLSSRQQKRSHLQQENDVNQLRESLSLQLTITEQLQRDNARLKEELDRIRLLYVNTVEHSTILENELDEKYDEVSRLAVTDPLTGVYNRLKFHQTIRVMLDQQNPKPKKFALIMFDIDHFKQVNDSYGHDAGDRVLVSVTRVANSIIRKSDMISRWGGEEFVILLPDAGLVKARQIAERIREKIEAADQGMVGKVTCSFGVAEYRSKDDAVSIMKRVDQALYQAKEGGRNRVIIQSEVVSEPEVE